MVTRRKFLGMLAILPAVTALAGAGLRLPRREDVEVDVNPYLTSNTAWYLTGPDALGIPRFYRHAYGNTAPLSEESLEDMLNQMRDNEVLSMYHVRPTKLVVPPRMAERANYVLTHRPTLLERLLWRLFPVD